MLPGSSHASSVIQSSSCKIKNFLIFDFTEIMIMLIYIRKMYIYDISRHPVELIQFQNQSNSDTHRILNYMESRFSGPASVIISNCANVVVVVVVVHSLELSEHELFICHEVEEGLTCVLVICRS